MVKIYKWIPLCLLLGAIIFFFLPFIISQKLPVPSDTIVGLYHPYRDLYSKDYPNGIPYKNFLITDPVRQTFVWKELSMDIISNLKIPSWNPYEMTGKPLAPGLQSGSFYPLNIILFIIPFHFSWSLFIMLQPILLGVFMYMYLRNLKLNVVSVTLSSLAITFSGFSVSWLEWGNILHTALWLPLVLLSIDREFGMKNSSSKSKTITRGIFVIAITMSFLAGHLQIFFYSNLIVIGYFLLRWIENKSKPRTLILYALLLGFCAVITIIQWVPTLIYILNSSRSVDQNFASVEGWFVPFKHLIQLIAPDFFGNPATLNYWGTWNYGELTSYIGLVPLGFALFAFIKRNSTITFFGIVILLSLLFALPTGISSLPYIFNIPLLSTAQPTRLLFPFVFSLSILAGYGLANFLLIKKLSLKLFTPQILLISVFAILWIFTIFAPIKFFGNVQNADISFRNLIIPSVILAVWITFTLMLSFIKKYSLRQVIIMGILLLAGFELIRSAQKFTPFTNSAYLFPSTNAISFLKKQPGIFRVASTDKRILPPNFLTHYKIQTIEGYDPLYLDSYAQFIAVLERNKPDASSPYGYNRIITPINYNSRLYDFLNVEYVLTLTDLTSPKLTKVYEEGLTKIYRNQEVFPRAFFVSEVVSSDDVIGSIFQNDLRNTAVLNSKDNIGSKTFSVGEIEIVEYEENFVSIRTENSGEGYLVISDAYYPTWDVYIDGEKSKIYKTNNSFRGIIVPRGVHSVELRNSLF